MLFIKLLLLGFLLAPSASASPRGKVIKLSVTNPSAQARAQENVVVSVAELKRVAPDFRADAIVVSVESATTLRGTARAKGAIELASQADDLDGDGSADEIAFQIDLRPKQTRVVMIAYGEGARSRSDYPSRTHAKFTTKFEGMGWESELNAWRLYFDHRNAIDLFGKRKPGLYLETFGSPGYDYHEESPMGRDIYKIGDALGLGAVGALVDGKAVRVSDVRARRWRIINAGPVRAVVELSYEGWKVSGREVNLTSRIIQWAGRRDFEHHVTARGAEGLTLVTGLPRKPGLEEKSAGAGSPMLWRATWGHQVLKTGATATESLPDQNLGLAIIAPGRTSRLVKDDALNFLLQPEVVNGAGFWHVLAAWDQEGRSAGESAAALMTLDDFLELVHQTGRRLVQPVRVKIL